MSVGLKWIEIDGLRCLSPNGVGWPENVVVGFTTRVGGKSTGAYAGLNIGLGSGDVPETVLKNRERLAVTIGLPLSRWVVGGQVHGVRVTRVESKDAGRGSTARDTVIKETDGLATDAHEVGIFTITADCLPVALVDPDRPAVATLHAGWRGTAAGMATEGVRAMRENFESDPTHLWGIVGPGIGGCCYQVGPEVAEKFDSAYLRPDPDAAGKSRLDLPAANKGQLVAAGLSPERILMADLCTNDRPDLFYSWRRYKTITGRQAGFAFIRGKS